MWNLDKKRILIIFGYADLGRALYSYLKTHYRGKRVIYCDNSSLKREHEENVYSVQETVAMYRKEAGVFFIASLYHYKDMRNQLLNLGVVDEDIVKKLPSDIVNKIKNKELEKKMVIPKILNFEINILKKCNLRCQCCNNFSPLVAEEEFCDSDMEIVKEDLLRIKKLFSDSVGRIYISGGEPLMHPRLLDYIKFIRKTFMKADIAIITNGILLLNMKQNFWDICRDNNIILTPTKYPINVKYDLIMEKAKQNGVRCKFFGSSESGRTSWHFPFDLQGKQDYRESFYNCYNAMNCITLYRGKLYPCSLVTNIDIFNRYFDKNLTVLAEDGVDIYEYDDRDTILKKLIEPMKFCRYCDVKHRTYDNKWEISKKSIKEWTL